MKSVVVTLLLAGLCSTAIAQINKCKGPGGKIIYSDAACDMPDKMERIKTHQNTVDASGDRRNAQEMRARSEMEDLQRNPPQECQFEGKSGKRQQLARRASEECVKNKIAERNGERASYVAQQNYRDNEEHRRRLIEGVAAANAAAAANSRRSITCMSMGPGMATCR